MIVVPRVNTPLDPRTFPARILTAFRAIGVPLTSTQAVMLATLVYVETGGGKAVQNYSPGNISANERYGGAVWRPPWFAPPTEATSERNRHLHAEMLAGRAPSAFRAYASEAEGWEDFARFMTNRYPNVLQAAKRGNPDAFRRELAKAYSKDYGNPAVTVTFGKLMQQYGLAGGTLGASIAVGLILAALFYA